MPVTPSPCPEAQHQERSNTISPSSNKFHESCHRFLKNVLISLKLFPCFCLRGTVQTFFKFFFGYCYCGNRFRRTYFWGSVSCDSFCILFHFHGEWQRSEELRMTGCGTPAVYIGKKSCLFFHPKSRFLYTHPLFQIMLFITRASNDSTMKNRAPHKLSIPTDIRQQDRVSFLSICNFCCMCTEM